ncbi:MAG: AEC family transporter [Firmicutes bacterium]|nr:AEC family transporter [Bacillota bacterium]
MFGKYFVLFAILFTGYFLRKINFIDDKMNNSVNKLIVYFAYPCLIVHNIGNIDMSGKVITSFMLAFGLSLAFFYLYGAVAFGYAKGRHFPEEDSPILEFAMTTPNNGFMGFPVTLLFFGEFGMLLMLAHNAAMNFFIFTYCIKLLRRNEEGTRKATPGRFFKATLRFLLNPNILALLIGFILSLLGGLLPEAVDEYLVYIGNISTPMAMIFIGSTLTAYSFKDIIKSKVIIETSIVKLLIMPAVTLAIVYFLPIAPIIKCVVVLGACFPTAATVPMLSEQEGHDPGAGSKALFLSTVASIVTVPVIIKLLMMLFM